MRLVWYTEGKGDQDLSVVDVERFDHPPLHDRRRCSFTLPEGPYGFSGHLISLLWCAELVVLPKGPSRRLDLTVGPEGKEVRVKGGAEVEPRRRRGREFGVIGKEFWRLLCVARCVLHTTDAKIPSRRCESTLRLCVSAVQPPPALHSPSLPLSLSGRQPGRQSR